MKRIAFLSFDWDYEIVSEYYLGLQDHLKDYDGIQVVIFNAFGHYYASHKPDTNSFEVFSLCDLDDYDAFLIQGNRSWPPELRQKLVDKAVAQDKPVVSINYNLSGAHSVGTNNYLEEYGLVYRVLRDRRCTKVAFVNGLKTSAEAQARAQGYRDACRRLGVLDVRFYQANWQMEAGVATAYKLLRHPDDLPEVVFCCNDDLAVGVQQTLQEAGVRVPEDVMITGFDNREISQRATPRITTIDRDYRTIAGYALKTIVQLMDGQELRSETYSPAKHVLAKSCSYPAAHSSEQMNELYGVNCSLKRFFEVLGSFQFAMLGAHSLYNVLEQCERFARELDCPNTFLSFNGSYPTTDRRRDSTAYGPESHLVACRGTAVTTSCDERHVYYSYDTKRILPPEIAFDQPIYTVCPLRHNDTCMGMLVTEGVPTVMRYGYLSFFLTMLAGTIETMHKDQLIESHA